MSYQEQTTAGQGVTVDERLGTHNIFDTLEDGGTYARFVEALRKQGMEGLLKGSGNFTVLALPESAGFDIGDVALHVCRGKVLLADMRTAEALTTTQGVAVPIAISEGHVRCGGATVVHADIACTNGVIHTVDRPITAPEQ